MMNVVSVHDLNKDVELISSDDEAMFLNLTFKEIVDELLEFITIYTDDELIQEITNVLNLDTTMVVEPTNHGQVVVGYLKNEGST